MKIEKVSVCIKKRTEYVYTLLKNIWHHIINNTATKTLRNKKKTAPQS